MRIVMLLSLLLAVTTAPAATWFTRTYDAAIFDWCIDRYGNTDAAQRCMRNETREQRETVGFLRAEVRDSAAQRDIFDLCNRRDGAYGQRQVNLCVRSEAEVWRRRNFNR